MKLKYLVGVSSLLLLTPAHALTLTEAVDRALEFNPIVKSLEASVDVNKARLRQSYSGYQPAITWQAEKGKSRSTGSKWEDKTKSTVSLNQVVYDFGRISNTVDSRKHKLTAAEHTYKDGSEKLALLTTKAYLEILKLEEVIDFVEENIAFYKRFLGILETRNEAGAASKSDVQRLNSLSQNAELELIQYKTDLTFARKTFKSLTGIEQDNLTSPVLDGIVIEHTLEQLVEFATSRSYQIQALKANIHSAEENRDKAKSDLYPSFGLKLETTREFSQDTSAAWKTTESGLVTMTYKLWDGFKTRRKVDESNARVMQAEYRLREAALTLEKKVEEAYSSTLKLMDEKVVNDRAMETNREIVDLYYKEFELGEKTLLDITTAQGDYHISRIQSAVFQYDFYKSVLDIRFYLNDVINTIRSLQDS